MGQTRFDVQLISLTTVYRLLGWQVKLYFISMLEIISTHTN